MVQLVVHKLRALVNVLVIDDCMQFFKPGMPTLVWWVVWKGDVVLHLLVIT